MTLPTRLIKAPTGQIRPQHFLNIVTSRSSNTGTTTKDHVMSPPANRTMTRNSVAKLSPMGHTRQKTGNPKTAAESSDPPRMTWRESQLLSRKVGAALAVARRGGALNTLDTLVNFFLIQDMYLVGSSYWPIAYGQIPGDVIGDDEGIATAQRLGENMQHLLTKLFAS